MEIAGGKSTPTVEGVPPKIAGPTLKPKVDVDESDRLQKTKERVVLVQRGESLYRIIFKNYGTYNSKILGLVLRENPKILNPSHVAVGQPITLPDINQLN